MYFKHNTSGKLIGIISSHIDNINLAETDQSIRDVTKKMETTLNVWKVEDYNFQFTRIDMKKTNNGIKISMEDYTKSLDEIEIRDGKNTKPLTREELKVLRKYVGTLSWLAAGTRPDLSVCVLKQANKQKNIH